MLCAVQSPLQCHFLRLTTRPQPAICGSPEEFFQRRPDEFVHDFIYRLGAFVDDRDVPFTADGSDVMVIKDGLFWLGGRYVSDAVARSFVAEVAQLGPTSRNDPDVAAARPRARPMHHDSELARRHPWLVNYMSADAPPAAEKAEGDGAVYEYGEEEWEAVQRELEERRAEWAEAHAAEGEHFAVILRGGKWTARHRGRAFDVIAGEARTALAATWCGLYQLQKSVRFSIALYGEEAATHLATEWVRRMGLYFARWWESGEVNYEYTDADYTAVPDSLEFTDLVLGSGVESPLWDRAMQVLAMRPVHL